MVMVDSIMVLFKKRLDMLYSQILIEYINTLYIRPRSNQANCFKFEVVYLKDPEVEVILTWWSMM
jgi:hypothetical protein